MKPLHQVIDRYRSSCTPREKEVLDYMLQGLQRPKIADKMFICEKSVACHITNILQRWKSISQRDFFARIIQEALKLEDTHNDFVEMAKQAKR